MPGPGLLPVRCVSWSTNVAEEMQAKKRFLKAGLGWWGGGVVGGAEAENPSCKPRPFVSAHVRRLVPRPLRRWVAEECGACVEW